MTAADFFQHIFLPATLILIMGGIGMELTVKDFRNIFLQPRALTIGLACQLILLPVTAFVINLFYPLSPADQVGLVLIAASPGGSASGLVSHLIRANVALSIAMTSINNLIILITIPLITNLALNAYMGGSAAFSLPVGDAAREIFLVTLLPVAVGMLLRHYRPVWADLAQKPLRYLMPAMLLIAFGGIYFSGGSSPAQGGSSPVTVLLPALLLNAVAMLLAALTARLLRLDAATRATVVVEVGLQNSALAIFVASTLLGEPRFAVVAMAYSAFSFFTTAAGGWWVRHKT